jgi:hypothetical protein
MNEQGEAPVKGKRGRKSDYDPNVHPARAKALAEGLRTDVEIAASLGIGETTFYAWQRRYAKFRQAVRAGKEGPNEEVQASLRHLCLPHKVRKVIAVPDPTPSDPKHVKVLRVEETDVDPSPISVKFFLMNRRPDKWKERIEAGTGLLFPTSVTVNLVESDGEGNSRKPTD